MIIIIKTEGLTALLLTRVTIDHYRYCIVSGLVKITTGFMHPKRSCKPLKRI